MRTQLNFFVFHYIYGSEHKHDSLPLDTKKFMCLSIGIFSAFPTKSYGRNWFLEPWVTHCLGFSRCLSLLRRFSLEKFISLVRRLHAIFQFGLELTLTFDVLFLVIYYNTYVLTVKKKVLDLNLIVLESNSLRSILRCIDRSRWRL